MKYKFIKKGYLKRACSGMMVIIFLVLFVVPCLLYAQEPGDTLWTRTYGGSEDDNANCVQQTADGGYIIVGRTLSFGAASYDVYLVKTDANGDTIWTRTYGGSEIDDANFVQQTTDGGYIIVGRTQSLGAGSYDVYLIKTDATGDTIWTRTYGGENSDNGSSVQQTTDGGYVTTGSTESFGAGRSDVYLVKTDADGDTPHNPNQLGERAYGGSMSDFGLSVRQTTDGGYIIAGKTSSFGAGSSDVYLVKVDSDGDTLWTRAYGGSSIDGGYSIQQTSDGNYIVVGSTASFGSGGPDIWLLKIDVNGDTLWTHTYGGSESSDYGKSVQQVTDGGYIIAGSYSEDLGAGQSDIYLLRTNSNGDTIWTRTYGGSENESSNSCQQTDDGGYIIAGKTDSFGAGSKDVYLVRVAGQLPAGSISGAVTEAGSRVPIQGVYVEVFGTEISDSTDINGEYTLPDLSPGIYEVSFSHEVYRDTTVTGVEVISGEVTVLDVQMYIPLPPGTITGVVTDSATSSPIADVLVEAIGEDVSDNTDADGQYTLADLDPGAHDVSFSHIDYNDTVVTDVLVTSGEVTTLNVEMTPRPTLINIPADYPTIQAGIDSSFDGDTVLVQPGTYVENVNFNGHNVVLGSLFLTTGDPSYISSTIIDGDSSNWVVAFGSGEDSTAVIAGFTIQNGYALYGGGIVCGGSGPTISNNIIAGNSASMIGGGIYCDDSSPTIMNNTISGNQCSEGHEKGGGIAILSSYAIIINNTISDNVAELFGGGIYCENYNLQNDNSTISHNTITGNSGYDGGGIWMRANATVSNNIIHGNHAHADFGQGGGIYSGSSTSPTFDYNTISGNSAAWGAGMYCAGDTGTAIINNTITGNSASFSGGGLYYASSSNPTITNNIFWADSAPENMEIYSGASSPVITYCDVQGGWEGEGNIDCDPMFCYPDTGNYYLHVNSCCVGAGQGGVDIGAFGVGCTDPILGSITGTVTEAGSRTPIQDVLVEAVGSGITDSTDINGEYTLPDLNPSIYEVSFSHDDYRDTTVTGVEVISGEATVLDVQISMLLPPGTITGVVTDSAMGDPIVDVLVEAIGTDVSDNTNVDGQYTLAELDPDSYDVSFSHVDFHDTTVTGVIVASDDTTILNVEMPPRRTLINIPADYPTIQEGIDASFDGDTVLVQPGTYVENVNFNGKSIVVGSLFLTTDDDSYISTTIIDGNSSGSVATFENGEDNNAVITGFTIQNGSIVGGGGIYCNYSGPTISYNTINGNSADNAGGGIFCFDNSSPLINYNTICGNTANWGGGISCIGYCNPTISNNTISGNTAISGGGFNCFDSGPITVNTIFWGNTATSEGDEIYIPGGSSPSFTYCDIQDTLWPGEGNIDCDPMFCYPDTGNYYLHINSCCVGAGQGGVDIGAFGVGCGDVGYEYLPGDVNMALGIWPPTVIGGDVTYLVGYFIGGGQESCLLDGFWCSADINGDCVIIGGDVTALVGYFVAGGTITPCPDYESVWPPLPPEAPADWPNCDTPVINSRVIPTGSDK